MDHQISSQELWKAAIASSKTTLSLLSAFECNGNPLVGEALEPLKRLVQQEETAIKTTHTSCPSSNTALPAKPSRSQKHDQLESNWERLSEGNGISVSLKNGGNITAIAITTEAQIEAILPEIYAADFIAVDCEFLGIKNEMPLLKLIQIAVSKQKGYAIQVDLVGLEGITKHLKPLLENESVNQVGWAYRGDAMAIENYIHDIRMAPVLDLQAKLRPIAIEELSLNTAVARYAAQWEGYDDFMLIKQFRDGFSFSLNDCVWTKNPLPARALVYSIFDVVCLFALAEAVVDHPNLEQHYWPLTVTQSLKAKALDRWHRQRVIGKQPSAAVVANTVAARHTPPTKKKQGSTAAPTVFYDDSNPQFQKDLEEALKKSQKEYDNWHEDQEDIVEVDSWREELKDNPTVSHFAPEQSQTTPDVTGSGWGDEEPVQPKQWPYERPARSASKKQTQASDKKQTPKKQAQASDEKQTPKKQWGDGDLAREGSPQKQQGEENSSEQQKREDVAQKSSWGEETLPKKQPWGQEPALKKQVWGDKSLTPKKTSREGNPSRFSPKQPPKTPFQAKPDRERYSADLKNRVNGQTGKFNFVENKPEELAEAKWSQFATESEGRWKRGKDSSLSNIKSSYTPQPVTPIKKEPPNTSVNSYSLDNSLVDNWSLVDEQPRSMEMQMNQIPIRSRFTGPKLNNPYDDGFDDDDDEEEDEDIKAAPRDTPTFLDDLYLNDSPGYLSVHKIVTFEHLDLIVIPSTPFTAAITYHTIKNSPTLKAIQIYLATQDKGESYTIVLDQACMLRERKKYANTNLGYLLTSPDVKRVIWYLSYIRESVKEKLGFYIGPCIDVAHMVYADLGKEFSFHAAVVHYLKDWPDFEQYQEKKAIQDKAASKTFGYVPWDERKLRSSVLEHSAFCGLVLYKLFQSPKSLDHVDSAEFTVS
ncbi:hypothetical protein BY458DRAFT_506772 [Sporodiniella umbellata]|nr:hypothetical protein BY458DRAFT_506772 [Sporodiniella umbellata]